MVIMRFLSLFLVLFFLFLPHGSAEERDVVNIGAIIDVGSRGGKEEKVAMEIAARSFNDRSETRRLSLHFVDSGRSPLRAASAAEELTKEKQVEAILGMETWEETSIVSEVVSNQPNQTLVMSFAQAPLNPPLRWPFLVRMSHDMSEQIKCIAFLVRSYQWRKIIVITEQDSSSTDSTLLFPLSQALHNYSGAEIELVVSLPPFSSISRPRETIKEELEKVLTSTQSRVFVVLRSSFSMSVHLFEQAKKIGLVERDSVWIVTDSIATFLDSYNTSVIASMDGSLGLKTYYNEDTESYKDFHKHFRKLFKAEYQEEDYFEPGFRAIRAYNSIKLIAQAISNNTEDLLERVKLRKFEGLSGESMRFVDGGLEQGNVLRVVNVVGKRYKELGFWVGDGFSERVDGSGKENVGGVVNWPGDLNMPPKGWEMPAKTSPMIIGVPARTSFDRFVKVVKDAEVSGKVKYSGFCVELFCEVLGVLKYDLPYEFVPYNGTYDHLVGNVSNKRFDAIVGDMTILAGRMELVEFTQPYAESGLSMIVAVKSKESAWIFLKPFSFKMWIVTAASLLYTVFIVWFLEHHSNPVFKQGSWKDQIGNALWFTFSSVFYAHSDRIESNLTRVVVVVWLFLVMVLTSSYTASLSSMLTVQKLEASPLTIESLKKSNAKVGCDGDSFVRNYLQNVLGFNESNILNVDNQDKYDDLFKSGNISAAFLELPYEKVFINQYCKGYVATAPTYRFGGLAFVFQKGSPISKDFSKAILKLSEDGTLKQLEDKWFGATTQCATNNLSDDTTESLKLQSFWALYVFSGATSTTCLLLFVVFLQLKYRRDKAAAVAATPYQEAKIWNKVADFARYFYIGEIRVGLPITGTTTPSRDGDEWSSSPGWECVSTEDTPELRRESGSQPEIEMT